MEIRLENRGTLIVCDNDKYIRITGELSAGPNYIFYADLISLDYWTDGLIKVEMEKDKRDKFIRMVKEAGEKIGLKILFD